MRGRTRRRHVIEKNPSGCEGFQKNAILSVSQPSTAPKMFARAEGVLGQPARIEAKAAATTIAIWRHRYLRSEGPIAFSRAVQVLHDQR